MTVTERIFLLGLDAVHWDYLDPVPSAGHVLTLQRLIGSVCTGSVDTTDEEC